MDNSLTFTKIDQLGAILAQIKALQAEAEAIKDELKDQLSMQPVDEDGVQRLEVDGVLYKAVCHATNVSTTDTKKLYAHYGITETVLAQFKKKPTARYSVEITANK
jgi:hypothetical protein